MWQKQRRLKRNEPGRVDLGSKKGASIKYMTCSEKTDMYNNSGIIFDKDDRELKYQTWRAQDCIHNIKTKKLPPAKVREELSHARTRAGHLYNANLDEVWIHVGVEGGLKGLEKLVQEKGGMEGADYRERTELAATFHQVENLETRIASGPLNYKNVYGPGAEREIPGIDWEKYDV